MSPGDARRLVVFTRYPEPGRVKTRLIPLLGQAGAAELHEILTCHTLAAACDLRRRLADVDVVVRFTGGSRSLMERLYGTQRVYQEQGDGDLGTRLARAIDDAFHDGRAQVVVIGSDCPELTGESLDGAFGALGSADLVLGPALDGGYYLIGLRSPRLSLFAGIPWGTGEVLDRTLREAGRLALDTRLLPTLRDVDTPDDLRAWQQAQSAAISR